MIPNCTIWITKTQKSKLDNLKVKSDEPYYQVLDRLLDDHLSDMGLEYGYTRDIKRENR
jgi:hypothetical protein